MLMKIISLYLVNIVLGTILRGVVIWKLWDWFMVPNFHLPPLRIALAIGLGLLVSYMSGAVVQGWGDIKKPTAKKAPEEWLREEGPNLWQWVKMTSALTIAYPFFFLLLGYVVSLFTR